MSQLAREAESRFDAGACREAIAFAQEKTRREAERQKGFEDANLAIRDAESALKSLEEKSLIARGITFIGHLMGHEPPSGLQSMLDKPLIVPPQDRKPVSPAGKLEPAPNQKSPEVSVAAPIAAPMQSEPLALPPPPPAKVLAAAPPPNWVLEQSPPPTENLPLVRLRAAAGLGVAVAKADGRMAASEKRQIRVFLERRYASTPDLLSKLDGVLSEIGDDVPTLGAALAEVRRVVPKDAWPELYQFAVSIADAAGERNTREIECLARVAEELGTSTKPVPAPPPVSPPLKPDVAFTDQDSRSALEIAPETALSVDLIRRQYHLLSDRFAAEKFANHGPEFVQMAAEKRERVERAARHLLAEYNEPLEPPHPAPPTDLRHNPDLDEVFGG
jgi:uncharacterized tellurite resistance protein B-like protein